MTIAAIGLQYVQMRQLNSRNPASGETNPNALQLQLQRQRMQRFLPIVFAVIYISIPAGVNVYFIASSLFRVSQQALMYRHDPHLRSSLEGLRRHADPG